MDCITAVAYALTRLDEITECSELWHMDPI